MTGVQTQRSHRNATRPGALCALALALAFPATHATADDAQLIHQLQAGGLLVLIRHAATEPGTGDPPAFRLGDCSTQRNLSAAGRTQARALGEWFRSWQIPVSEVRSSRWCRCLDTATEAFAPQATVTPWPPLDSFFGARHREPGATAAARAALATPHAGNRVWVTHQVNITALSGVYPAPGELILMRPSPTSDGRPQLEHVGRLLPATPP